MSKLSWMVSGVAALGLWAGHAVAQDAKPMPGTAPAMAAPVVIGSGCCTTPCATGCCDPCCETKEEPNRSRILADVGFMILTPKWKDNPAYYVTNFSTDPFTHEQQNFSFHGQFVPQISLGFIGRGGLGARIGWWGFAQSTNEVGTTPNDDVVITAADPLSLQAINEQPVKANFTHEGDSVATRAQLRLNVWDFEVVQSFGNERWSCLGSGGIRYAHVSQEYDAVKIQSFASGGAPPGPRGFIVSGHNFNGAGPTLALEARRLLGGTGAYLYGKTRGSLLFGTFKQEAHLGNFNTNERPDSIDGLSRSNGYVPVGELEMGLGFERVMGRIAPFLQLGFVTQGWGNIGSSSESTLSAEENNGDTQSSISRDGGLGLIGFSMKFGLTY